MTETKIAQRPGPGLSSSDSYERDFYAWTRQQAELLRFGALSDLDRENLAEEIESLGRSDKREIRNRLRVLLTHLLKWRFQSDCRGSSWLETIDEQRARHDAVIADSPSLRGFPDAIVGETYRVARRRAAREFGLNEADLPEVCPFSIDEVLDDGFWPGEE